MSKLIDETSFFVQDNQKHTNVDIANDLHCCIYNDYNNNSSIAGEIALWRAVLLQALIDLKSQSRKKRNQPSKKAAYNWFTKDENDADVRAVCFFARYDYKIVKQLADEIIAESFNYVH